MEELIEKVREYMATHEVDPFNSALVETEISLLETDKQSMDVFKIHVSVILGIDVGGL